MIFFQGQTSGFFSNLPNNVSKHNISTEKKKNCLCLIIYWNKKKSRQGYKYFYDLT